jgi:hypothetical protein
MSYALFVSIVITQTPFRISTLTIPYPQLARACGPTLALGQSGFVVLLPHA